jgi:hypothetical protein
MGPGSATEPRTPLTIRVLESEPTFNDDGELDISGAVSILGHLSLGDPILPLAPYDACGRDPTPDALVCERFTTCR